MTDPKRWVAIPPLTVENGFTYAGAKEKDCCRGSRKGSPEACASECVWARAAISGTPPVMGPSRGEREKQDARVKPHYGDNVHAAECAECGVTFDVRTTDLEFLHCPICRAQVEVKLTWPADDGGYHTSHQVILGLASLLKTAERQCSEQRERDSREKQDDEAEISRLARRVETLTVELNKAHRDIATLLEQLSDANVRLNERSDA